MFATTMSALEMGAVDEVDAGDPAVRTGFETVTRLTARPVSITTPQCSATRSSACRSESSPPRDVPAPESGLDVGDAGQGRRSEERRRARVGGVPPGPLHQALVVEVRPGRTGRACGTGRSRSGRSAIACAWRATSGSTSDRRRTCARRRPRSDGRAGRRPATRLRRRSLKSSNECGRLIAVVEDRQLAAVAPAVPELRIEADQVDLLVERRSRDPEQFVEHVREGDQRRPDVERVAVARAATPASRRRRRCVRRSSRRVPPPTVGWRRRARRPHRRRRSPAGSAAQSAPEASCRTDDSRDRQHRRSADRGDEGSRKYLANPTVSITAMNAYSPTNAELAEVVASVPGTDAHHVAVDGEGAFEDQHHAEPGDEPADEVGDRDASIGAHPDPAPVALADHLRVEEQVPGRQCTGADAARGSAAVDRSPSAAWAASRAGNRHREPGQRDDRRARRRPAGEARRCTRSDRTAGRSASRSARPTAVVAATATAAAPARRRPQRRAAFAFVVAASPTTTTDDSARRRRIHPSASAAWRSSPRS